MLVWKKSVAAAAEDDWIARLGLVFDERRLVVSSVPGGKNASIEIYGVSAKEARELVDRFGGGIRDVREQKNLQPPPRAPIRVREKLLVVSSERERKANAKKFPGREIILLPAGMAFGTGEHATTATCLRFLADVADEFSTQGWDMLDLGTGSGLLAIAAKKLGARRVDAFDFDPPCVRIAKENAVANHARIFVNQADVTRWRPARAWRVVVANIYSEILIRSARTIARATASNGVLIFSGVLRGQEKDCARAFAASGFRVERVVRKGKWVTARMRKVKQSDSERCAHRELHLRSLSAE